MSEPVLIVKLSGKILSDEENLARLLRLLKDRRAIIVHGGGVKVDELQKALGLKTVKIDGLRVSPAAEMPYITAALAGL